MTKAMTLRLPDELHEWARIRAFETRTTITAVIIKAIEDGLPDSAQQCDATHCRKSFTRIGRGGFHFCDEHFTNRADHV